METSTIVSVLYADSALLLLSIPKRAIFKDFFSVFIKDAKGFKFLPLCEVSFVNRVLINGLLSCSYALFPVIIVTPAIERIPAITRIAKKTNLFLFCEYCLLRGSLIVNVGVDSTETVIIKG